MELNTPIPIFRCAVFGFGAFRWNIFSAKVQSNVRFCCCRLFSLIHNFVTKYLARDGVTLTLKETHTHTQKNMQVFSKMCTRTNNCSFNMSQFLSFHAIGLLSHSYTKNTRLMFRGYDEFEYFEQRFISLMLNSLQAFGCKCSVVYLLSVKFILYWNNFEI